MCISLIRCIVWSVALSAGMYTSQIWSTQFLEHDNVFSNPLLVTHMVKTCSCLKKSVAYHNWFALSKRPVSDAHAPSVLPGYLKMVLSKNVMRNVARFRIRGHGLKCEADLYGRSPDRSARVCICVKTGISKMGKTYFSCMGAEHLRHQFNHLFDNISNGEFKGFVF